MRGPTRDQRGKGKSHKRRKVRDTNARRLDQGEKSRQRIRNDEFQIRRSRALGRVLRLLYIRTGSKIVWTGHSYLLLSLRLILLIRPFLLIFFSSLHFFFTLLFFLLSFFILIYFYSSSPVCEYFFYLLSYIFLFSHCQFSFLFSFSLPSFLVSLLRPLVPVLFF